MRNRVATFMIGDAEYDIDFYITSYGTTDSYCQPGDPPEWEIKSITDQAGNNLTGVSGIYEKAETYLADNPELFIYEDDYDDCRD